MPNGGAADRRSDQQASAGEEPTVHEERKRCRRPGERIQVGRVEQPQAADAQRPGDDRVQQESRGKGAEERRQAARRHRGERPESKGDGSGEHHQEGRDRAQQQVHEHAVEEGLPGRDRTDECGPDHGERAQPHADAVSGPGALALVPQHRDGIDRARGDKPQCHAERGKALRDGVMVVHQPSGCRHPSPLPVGSTLNRSATGRNGQSVEAAVASSRTCRRRNVSSMCSRTKCAAAGRSWAAIARQMRRCSSRNSSSSA